MLRRIFLHLIVCSFLFSGCHSTTPNPIPSSPTYILSTPTQNLNHELDETVTPAVTQPLSSPTIIPATAYPIPIASSTEGSSYPAPVSNLTPVPPPLPFSDCGRTPGLTGCDPSAPPLAGHIAYYDTENNRLVGLDLQTGQGWVVAIPKPKSLEWSPDGSQLLVRMNYPQDQPYVYEYLLFGKEGKLIRQFSLDKYVYWQPQGAILRTQDQQKIARSLNGAEAWLDSSIDGKTLHFRSSGDAEWKTAALEISPMEWPSELYGWIPGTSNVIITNGPWSVKNDVMLGHYLYMFNTQTEELRYLKGFNGHLDPQFAVVQGSNLAMIQLYYYLADDTLAILDGKIGSISYPLPRAKGEVQAYSIWQMAWQPGKKENKGLFVMMINMVETNLPNPPTEPSFPTSGIYFYNLESRQAQIVRETSKKITGGNFYWTDDGEYLLYCLGSTDKTQSAQTSLYVRQISTGKEWLMVDHLENPDLFLSYISWHLIAVFME